MKFDFFTANESFLNATSIVLTFHGLDTFATIYVNNVDVGKTSNMFLKYNFDIKNNLKVNILINVLFHLLLKAINTL